MRFEFGMPSPILVSLTSEPIETDKLIEFVTTPLAGAVVLFLGTVRQITNGQVTEGLEYEAYSSMALAKMEELAMEVRERWPVEKVAIEHRTGYLRVSEVSVAAAVSCPHRKDAFEAGEFLIDELKRRVPIWKREHWEDGTTEWVHPGLPQS